MSRYWPTDCPVIEWDDDEHNAKPIVLTETEKPLDGIKAGELGDTP